MDLAIHSTARRNEIPAQSNGSAGQPTFEKPPHSAHSSTPWWSSWKWVLVALVGVFALVGYGATEVFLRGEATTQLPLSLKPIPPKYDAERAMGYLIELCDLGPRPSGSQAMINQQDLLTEFFEARGGTVRLQGGQIRHPLTGENVPIANLIAAWNTEAPTRFLLCAHYDTRPYPDRDRTDPKGVFVGANDGASGSAALMELSHQFAKLPTDIGVDVVLFDAEEFVFGEGNGDYFLGSTLFAQQYVMQPPTVPYRSGVLLDMIGDRELQLLYERNSLRYARDVTKSVWRTARKLGVKAFVERTRLQAIRDDHLPLNEIAKIPTTDLIDFDYPRPGFRAPQYWHTTQDVPANCSGESIAAVIWVVHEWMLAQSNEK